MNVRLSKKLNPSAAKGEMEVYKHAELYVLNDNDDCVFMNMNIPNFHEKSALVFVSGIAYKGKGGFGFFNFNNCNSDLFKTVGNPDDEYFKRYDTNPQAIDFKPFKFRLSLN
jgi:hypothetical protein